MASRELEAKRSSLALIERLLADAVAKRSPPWTAVAQLTRQQAKLAVEIAKMEGEEEQSGGVTPDRLRAAILSLPPHLVKVAEEALIERKRR